jgi:hypothetical protein
MRWYLIPAVAAVTLALADTTPAKAQVIVRGYPTLVSPSPVPLAPFPGSSGVIPYASGGPFEIALSTALRSWAWSGYGPYAGFYPSPAYPGFSYGSAYQGYAAPWGVYRPYNVPANAWKWGDPWPSNNGWHKGWYKGGGKGGGKGGKGR